MIQIETAPMARGECLACGCLETRRVLAGALPDTLHSREPGLEGSSFAVLEVLLQFDAGLTDLRGRRSIDAAQSRQRGTVASTTRCRSRGVQRSQPCASTCPFPRQGSLLDVTDNGRRCARLEYGPPQAIAPARTRRSASSICPEHARADHEQAACFVDSFFPFVRRRKLEAIQGSPHSGEGWSDPRSLRIRDSSAASSAVSSRSSSRAPARCSTSAAVEKNRRSRQLTPHVLGKCSTRSVRSG